jgi:hypothetical protein
MSFVPSVQSLRLKNNVLALAKIGIGQSRNHTRWTDRVIR